MIHSRVQKRNILVKGTPTTKFLPSHLLLVEPGMTVSVQLHGIVSVSSTIGQDWSKLVIELGWLAFCQVSLCRKRFRSSADLHQASLVGSEPDHATNPTELVALSGPYL